MEFEVIAEARERETLKKIGKPRGEIIDTNKNELFKGLNTLMEIRKVYESFWNDLNKNSFEVVFVNNIKRL